jgi:hypothetical protein
MRGVFFTLLASVKAKFLPKHFLKVSARVFARSENGKEKKPRQVFDETLI